MAEKKELYWIGPGVVKHAGKSYGGDIPLPADLPESFLNANLKLGNIGEKMKTSEIIGKDASEEIKNLRTSNEKLEKAVAELKQEIADKEKVIEELSKDSKAKDSKEKDGK